MLDKLRAVVLRLWFLVKPRLEKSVSTLFESGFKKEYRDFYLGLVGVLSVAILLANVAVVVILPQLLAPALKPMVSNKSYTERDLLNEHPRPNFRDIKKQVIDRNIFNAKGEVPPESDESSSGSKGGFDPKAPCTPTKLKIALLGTIYSPEGGSLATIKEDGFEMPDVYKVGDVIIGHEESKIYDITRNNVVINNAGVKECLEIFPEEKKYLSAVSTVKSPSIKNSMVSPNPGGGSDLSNTISLPASWVESELGPGSTKIITTARSIPNLVDGQMRGFKFFDITPGSLMDKIGIKDGDVVLQVNNTPIEDNIFVLYQAFLDEREVRIRMTRGDASGTITVQIK